MVHLGRAVGAWPFSLPFLWGAWQLLGNTLPSCQVNQRRGELGTQEPVLAQRGLLFALVFFFFFALLLQFKKMFDCERLLGSGFITHVCVFAQTLSDFLQPHGL